MSDIDFDIGDHLNFDGKATSWLVRAFACSGRYVVATCEMFGQVSYTIIDRDEEIRGPLNIIGGGLGIDTTFGPDEDIDDLVAMLEGRAPWETGGFWEISHRGRVALNITHLSKPTAAESAG